MKSRLLIAIAMLHLCLHSLPAGTIPGRWEKIADLKPGSGFLVEAGTEKQFEAAFLRLDPDQLVVQLPDRSERVLPKTGVRRILRLHRIPDRKWDGTLIGAGIGFGGGFLGAAAVNDRATAGGPIWDGEAVALYTGMGLVTGVIGAITGALIDARHQDREVLYQAR